MDRSLARATVAAGLAASVALAAAAPAEETATADVVVVVDTSRSMKEKGMDPERTSLLVAKLLTDVVPGELAVVRLLDLVADASLLPNRRTGHFEPCNEDPTQQCEVVEQATDWSSEARRGRLGASIRPARGDAGYKRQLEAHLRQVGNNSPFGLALRAAQGVFDARGEGAATRTVIWLSDGRADDEGDVQRVVGELLEDGATVEAIVFGKGETGLARKLGLEPRQVDSPAGLMRAFADAFRAVVGAPYRIDATVAQAPSFEMQPNVDEAWVVVYGDDTLEHAELIDPAGLRSTADFAADRWPGAGAYRVSYLRRPAKGRWGIEALGGGAAAYAVVQRSDLQPVLLEPQTAVSGAETTLVAAVRAGLAGELVGGGPALEGATLTAELQGQTLSLHDGGTGGDAVAGDGRFSTRARFSGNGAVEVTLRLATPIVDRRTTAIVIVSGVFVSDGTPAHVDLGRLQAGDTVCRAVALPVERQGEVPLELVLLQPSPAHHTLTVRLPAGRLVAGGGALASAADDTVEVCLETGRHAPTSTSADEPRLALRLAGSTDPSNAVEMRLTWAVEALGFWALWGWLVLTVLAILATVFVIAGYLWPLRFQRSLALSFGPAMSDLDDQSPQPVAMWKGVGIGFYRHARAFLHPDFRLSGKSRGAVASLHAERAATRVRPCGATLYRDLDGEWEAVSPDGRRARPGDVYRVGEGGPFFRVSLQGGRR